jgi:hypothetical protein
MNPSGRHLTSPNFHKNPQTVAKLHNRITSTLHSAARSQICRTPDSFCTVPSHRSRQRPKYFPLLFVAEDTVKILRLLHYEQESVSNEATEPYCFCQRHLPRRRSLKLST